MASDLKYVHLYTCKGKRLQVICECNDQQSGTKHTWRKSYELNKYGYRTQNVTHLTVKPYIAVVISILH